MGSVRTHTVKTVRIHTVEIACTGPHNRSTCVLTMLFAWFYRSFGCLFFAKNTVCLQAIVQLFECERTFSVALKVRFSEQVSSSILGLGILFDHVQIHPPPASILQIVRVLHPCIIQHFGVSDL